MCSAVLVIDMSSCCVDVPTGGLLSGTIVVKLGGLGFGNYPRAAGVLAKSEVHCMFCPSLCVQ